MVYIERLGTWINGSGIQKLSKGGHLLWSISGGPKPRYRKSFKNYSCQSPRSSGKMRRGRGGRATWDGGDRGEAPRGGQEDGRGTLGARGQTPQGCAPTRGQQNQFSRS